MLKPAVAVVTFFLASSLAYATTPPSDASSAPVPTSTTLPDGTVETQITMADGSTSKAIKHPDGTMEAVSIDAKGNQTITTRHPDGTVVKKVVPVPEVAQ